MSARTSGPCRSCQKRHLFAAGCTTTPVHVFPEETGERVTVERVQLWAVVDAARHYLARSQGGRIGSTRHVMAEEQLELELARLPESVWTRS